MDEHLILRAVFYLTLLICTIVENNEFRKKRLDELQKVLYSQEYPQNLFQEPVREVTSIPNENIRASKAKADSNNLIFVKIFSPNNKNFSPLIQTAFQLLRQSYETKECFKDIKLKKKSKTAI